jgi:hypothetical protein
LNITALFDIRLPLFLGIAALSILFSIDIVTTEAILRLGGSELNTFMADVVVFPVAHLAVKGVVLVFVASIGVWADDRIPRSGLYTIVIIIGFYLMVALHNAETLFHMLTATT